MRREPECVLPCAAILGEGPVWVAREGALWFVDIKGQAIFRFDPATGGSRSWSAPAQPGWIVPSDDGKFLVGMQNGIHSFDPEARQFTLVLDPEPAMHGNRLNDAVVDRDGTIWLGSMDDDEAGLTGLFYRFASGHSGPLPMPPMCITNGPAIAPDQRTAYFTDTLERTIWQCPIHDDGTIGKACLFAQIEAGGGFPDGPNVDAEGCVWTGLFGGWEARRYDPDGALMARIAFPTANITKIAFGGPDLATAYATTARKGLDAGALAAQPEAGGLFAFDPGTRGIPGYEARVPT